MANEICSRVAAAAAALLLLSACGGDEEGPGATPVRTEDPQATRATWAAGVQTRCAANAPGRRATPRDGTAYAAQGLARLTQVSRSFSSGDAPPPAVRPQAEALMTTYRRLLPTYRSLASLPSRRAARSEVKRLREHEQELQRSFASLGIAACGPLAS